MFRICRPVQPQSEGELEAVAIAEDDAWLRAALQGAATKQDARYWTAIVEARAARAAERRQPRG